jgi:DNA-binding CsgD family transcriptional regulator
MCVQTSSSSTSGCQGVSGVDTIEQLGLLAPASRVLVFTRRGEPGGRGDRRRRQRLHTQERVARGDRCRRQGNGRRRVRALPKGAGKLLERIRERDIPLTATSDNAALAIRGALTARELEIFTRLASGERNQDIGRALSLSTNTVSNHIASILAKLHLDNRIQAAAQAVRSGLS